MLVAITRLNFVVLIRRRLMVIRFCLCFVACSIIFIIGCWIVLRQAMISKERILALVYVLLGA